MRTRHRRYMVALVAILAIGSTGCQLAPMVTLEAQTLPLTRTLAWDAATDADSYIVTQDGITVGTPTGLTQSITITTLGQHTWTVAAVNVFGTGPATALTKNVVSPGKSGNVRIQ